MEELDEIEAGEKYKFLINQRSYEYTATIDMETGMSPTTDAAVGSVEKSTYPNDGWEGKEFRIH